MDLDMLKQRFWEKMKLNFYLRSNDVFSSCFETSMFFWFLLVSSTRPFPVCQAYNVLTDTEKRRRYDSTGRAEKSAEEEFVEGFAGFVGAKVVNSF